MSVDNFHNLTYLPISDMNPSYHTRAVSSNYGGGGWARFSCNPDHWASGMLLYFSDIGNFHTTHSEGFIDSTGLIKAGTYYFECVVQNKRGVAQIGWDQGEVLYGAPTSSVPCKEGTDVIVPRVIRFDSDVRLFVNTSQRIDIKEVFIVPYTDIKSHLYTFNRLKYLPNNENRSAPSTTFNVTYHSLGQDTYYNNLEILTSFITNGSVKLDLGSAYSYGSRSKDKGWYREYHCMQVFNPSAPDYVDDKSTIQVRMTSNRGESGLDLTDFLYPANMGFGADNRVTHYYTRIGDYRVYDPNVNYNQSLHTFIPKFKIPSTTYIDRLSGFDFWDTGLAQESYIYTELPIFSRSIGVIIPPELDNWSYLLEPKAVLLTMFQNEGNNNNRNFRLAYTSSSGTTEYMFIGYRQPTVLLPIKTLDGLSITSLDGQNIGKFYLSIVMLP
ncbi:hypothetical protein KUA24_74 [Vibrio phage HNL01]|nr:hypothetical protein KUA24_74 [Vibrio phage HNL01]